MQSKSALFHRVVAFFLPLTAAEGGEGEGDWYAKQRNEKQGETKELTNRPAREAAGSAERSKFAQRRAADQLNANQPARLALAKGMSFRALKKSRWFSR